MGLITDTGVFIRAEREGHRDPVALIPLDEELGISSITLSELLEGIYYAKTQLRAERRRDFVERAKAVVPVIAFDETIAEVHAGLRAKQRSRGKMIGAHDLIIAATAMSLGWDVLTTNAAEFQQVEGLRVRDIASLSESGLEP